MRDVTHAETHTDTQIDAQVEYNAGRRNRTQFSLYPIWSHSAQCSFLRIGHIPQSAKKSHLDINHQSLWVKCGKMAEYRMPVVIYLKDLFFQLFCPCINISRHSHAKLFLPFISFCRQLFQHSANTTNKHADFCPNFSQFIPIPVFPRFAFSNSVVPQHDRQKKISVVELEVDGRDLQPYSIPVLVLSCLFPSLLLPLPFQALHLLSPPSFQIKKRWVQK